jgi:hypothetical protein
MVIAHLCAPHFCSLWTHCQQLHALIEETVRRCCGQLAFALCPTPLDIKCNPYIPRQTDAFKDSCELTQLALAV